nr:reverse transcriptase [Tanacetum cinerariifolium]GEY60668.1 reverse transcriptase [Tanacetum cinerariifolium]
ASVGTRFARLSLDSSSCLSGSRADSKIEKLSSLLAKLDIESSRSSTQTTKFPTQEDQILGYRAMTTGRYQVARATSRVFGRNNYNITIESAVDPERQLELSRERITGRNLELESKQENIARSAVYQELDLDDNWDTVSVDFDNSIVYSLSEGEACALCVRNYLGKIVNVKGRQPHKPEEEKDFSSNEKEEELRQSEKSFLVKDLTDALKIFDQLKIEQIRLEEQKNEEIKKLKTQLQKEKEKETKARTNFIRSMKGGIRIARDEITIYKKVTKIKTSNQTEVIEIAELEFDLKSRFHQVAMDEESIPWTSFLVPGGLYECIYLVFSKNEKEHANHLQMMLKICEDNGLVLSPTKMKTAVLTIDFLGAIIGEGTIKLQPHVIKRIVNFNEEELKTKKGLRMYMRNEAISSNNSLLSGGSPTVSLCLSEEYKDHMRRSHEDFQPLPRIFTKAIFIHEEPGSLYKYYQLKANQTLIRMDKSNAWRTITQYIKVSTTKEAVKAMRSLYEII